MKSFGPPSPSLRSPDFSAIRGARLTDSRITHYIKLGFYGEARRVELLASKPKPKTKTTKASTLSDALAILSTL